MIDERLLNVNRHGVLAVPTSLLMYCVFLLRHWLLLVLVGVSARRSPESFRWLQGDDLWVLLLIESPMLIFLLAMARRSPTAGPLVRAIWQRGKVFITVTAMLNVAWAVWYLYGETYWNPWPQRFILVLAMIEALVGVSVWKSDHYRHLFSEFPEADKP